MISETIGIRLDGDTECTRVPPTLAGGMGRGIRYPHQTPDSEDGVLGPSRALPVPGLPQGNFNVVGCTGF